MRLFFLSHFSKDGLMVKEGKIKDVGWLLSTHNAHTLTCFLSLPLSPHTTLERVLWNKYASSKFSLITSIVAFFKLEARWLRLKHLLESQSIPPNNSFSHCLQAQNGPRGEAKSSRDDISAIYSGKLINLFETEFSFQNGNFLKGNNYRDVKKNT